MEELPRKEIDRIHGLLLKDEAERDRLFYIYTNDILFQNSVAPFSIWPLPKGDVQRIHSGEVDYNTLPYEDQNEVEKGMLFEDQRRLIAEQYPTQEMFCEARGHQPCLRHRCPLFEPPNSKVGGKHGICREYKLAFRKSTYLSEPIWALFSSLRHVTLLIVTATGHADFLKISTAFCGLPLPIGK